MESLLKKKKTDAFEGFRRDGDKAGKDDWEAKDSPGDNLGDFLKVQKGKGEDSVDSIMEERSAPIQLRVIDEESTSSSLVHRAERPSTPSHVDAGRGKVVVAGSNGKRHSLTVRVKSASSESSCVSDLSTKSCLKARWKAQIVYELEQKMKSIAVEKDGVLCFDKVCELGGCLLPVNSVEAEWPLQHSSSPFLLKAWKL